VSMRISGLWRSRIATRSVSEGLLYPTFWVLSVRMEISVEG